jgi:hypothetical protein
MNAPNGEPVEELVGVPLIREDLRQLLVAAELHQGERQDKGKPRNARLDLAIKRTGGTASAREWQPKQSD